jgi:hypothetical protein
MPVALEPTPDHRDRLIVVGTSVRKPLDILAPFLQSLAWQEVPPRTRLYPVFVDDCLPSQGDAKALLQHFCAERGGDLLRGLPSGIGDFDDGAHLPSHQWSVSAMQRVGAHKNKILQRALELKADACWLVDSDLILDRTVLASLIACDKPIACAVYWTRWARQQTETQTIWAAPQVWLRHPYLLDGRGMDEAGFRAKLVSRQLTRVWGQGACTLLSRRVLEAGINFSPAPEVKQEGLMAGEDRQFCIKAERGHVEMWADPWPDIFHIYHRAEQVQHISAMLDRLGAEHPRQPQLGDLVNVVLTALEPIPTNNGWGQVPPQMVRGRLGALALAPELETAILSMERGSDRIIPMHCPIHHPMVYLRGRRRLIRVQLVDCKPFGAPPVLEEDLHITSQAQDLASLTPQQAAALEGDAVERALELVP